jgi:hypothetical protein
MNAPSEISNPGAGFLARLGGGRSFSLAVGPHFSPLAVFDLRLIRAAFAMVARAVRPLSLTADVLPRRGNYRK